MGIPAGLGGGGGAAGGGAFPKNRLTSDFLSIAKTFSTDQTVEERSIVRQIHLGVWEEEMGLEALSSLHHSSSFSFIHSHI